MDLDAIRPILSGLLGAAVATWLGRACASSMPARVGDKSADTLLRENQAAITMANRAFIGMLLASLLLYQTGFLARTDWRGFGLGIGGALTAPVVVLFAWSLASRRPAREAFAAYALSQKIPPAILYGLLAIGIAALTYTILRVLLITSLAG